jgi:hypothetical protein
MCEVRIVCLQTPLETIRCNIQSRVQFITSNATCTSEPTTTEITPWIMIVFFMTSLLMLIQCCGRLYIYTERNVSRQIVVQVQRCTYLCSWDRPAPHLLITYKQLSKKQQADDVCLCWIWRDLGCFVLCLSLMSSTCHLPRAGNRLS